MALAVQPQLYYIGNETSGLSLQSSERGNSSFGKGSEGAKAQLYCAIETSAEIPAPPGEALLGTDADLHCSELGADAS